MLKSLANNWTGLRSTSRCWILRYITWPMLILLLTRRNVFPSRICPPGNWPSAALPVAGGASNARPQRKGVCSPALPPLMRRPLSTLREIILILLLPVKGIFGVIMPDGSYAYTRAGNFTLDAGNNRYCKWRPLDLHLTVDNWAG